MKILQINSVCKRGSTGKIAYELYKRGNAAGHEFAVCYGRGKKIEEENIYKFGLDIETVFHALLTRITGYTGCFSPISTKRLIAFIDRFQPDIVHLHEPHAYFLNLTPFFEHLAAKKIPLVYTFHCEFAFTGKCGHPLRCENWKTGCGKCPNLKDYPKALFFDHTAAMLKEKLRLLNKQNMVIVSPSKWLADRAKLSLIKNKDVRVIPNGIDTEKVFYPRDFQHLRERHVLRDEKIVLAVAPGLMGAHKGGRDVLRLAEKLKDENIKFILIGLEEGELKENFAENVIALGRTENQQELAEYYSMADCFVICSDMESLPTTCLEAVCCGTVVAGFDVGGTAETAPYPIGRFVPYGDIDALCENVKKLISTPVSAELFDKQRELFSSKNMFDEYMSIYTELLDGKNK